MLLSLLLACSTASSSTAPLAGSMSTAAPAPGARHDADMATFRAARDRGAVGMILDVRTPEEFATGHVPGAVNVPIDALASRMGALAGEQGKEIYVICAVGGRSSVAADQLAAAGFSATNVLGGTDAWVASGGAVER